MGGGFIYYSKAEFIFKYFITGRKKERYCICFYGLFRIVHSGICKTFFFFSAALLEHSLARRPRVLSQGVQEVTASAQQICWV